MPPDQANSPILNAGAALLLWSHNSKTEWFYHSNCNYFWVLIFGPIHYKTPICHWFFCNFELVLTNFCVNPYYSFKRHLKFQHIRVLIKPTPVFWNAATVLLLWSHDSMGMGTHNLLTWFYQLNDSINLDSCKQLLISKTIHLQIK